MVRIKQEIIKSSSEWRSLLEKDLAGYPPEIINEKKAALNAARESLEWRRAEIAAQLLLLPKVNSEDVERELAELGEPWLMFDLSTQTEAGRHNELPLEQARVLRETLLRLGARYMVKNGEVRILGRLPIVSESQVCAKTNASGSPYAQ
ncbi:MAG: Recombinase protein [Dehalococcoidales bacterium]|nr:Recombinase protein [Dehalococcoidales bacterium]